MMGLKPDEVMRIAMPDLAKAVNKYLRINPKKDTDPKKLGLEFIKTRAERINSAFRWWGHKWIYDWEELERRIKEAGFKKTDGAN
jgi:predicted SAM-dependent methyltransferase